MAARREFRFPTPEEEYLFDPYLKDQIASYIPSSPLQAWVFYIQNRLTHILEEEKIPYTMKVPDENARARGRGLYISKWMIVILFIDEDGIEGIDDSGLILPMGISTRNIFSSNEKETIDHSMEQIVNEFETFLDTLYTDLIPEVSIFLEDVKVPKSWIRQNLS